MNPKAIAVIAFFSAFNLSAVLAGVWWWWIVSVVFGAFTLYSISD